MRRLLGCLVAATAVLGLAGVVILRSAPVIAEGRLLDFLPPGYSIEQVRVAGLELYVDTSLGHSDIATSTVLVVLAVFLLGVALELRRRDEPCAGTFAIAAAGALFLAGDDLLALHETIGHNLGFLTSVPGVDHPDDAVMGIYALVVIGFCFHHRELAPAGTSARTAWLAAAVLGGTAIVLDMLPIDDTRPEEGLEVLCALGLLAGAVLTARHALRRMGAAGLEPATSRV
jgi:hypothetical protein